MAPGCRPIRARTLERLPLEPLAALWHLLSFFAPAFGLGAIAASLARLFWWSLLKPVGWFRLCRAATLSATLALIVGLVVLGRDGRMGTYVAMVVASAVSLWWVGFRRATRA